MGSNASHENWCGIRGRECEQDAVQLPDSLSWAESISQLKSRDQPGAHVDTSAAHLKQSPTHGKDDELQGKIRAIVARAKQRKRSSLSCRDDELKDRILQGRINDAVRDCAERQVQSTLPSISRDDLQNQINVIVQARAESLNQHGQFSTEIASLGPARLVSDAELAHIAHLALSGAKARKTPAASPPAFYFESPAHGSDAGKHRLTIADCDGAIASQKKADEAKMSRVNVIAIPSPSRNVAKSYPWGCAPSGFRTELVVAR